MPAGSREACQRVYRLVMGIKMMPADTWAKRLALTKYKKDMLKLVWTLGTCGRLRKRPQPLLEIDAAPYCQAGNFSMRVRLEEVYLPLLARLGAKAKLVVIDKSKWLTPRGGLRREGWLMRLSFTKKAGGAEGLRAMQRWCQALEKKHRARAFARFSTGDMSLLARKAG
jgi:hypothetical protein